MCTPTSFDSKECDFSSLEKVYFEKDTTKWPSLLYQDNATPFYKIPNSREFVDFLKEFPMINLKKGTILCYSEKNMEIDPYTIWWNSIYPGKTYEKGAYFTFKTNYGADPSKIRLYYKLKKDVNLLFIPPIFKTYFEEENKEYFDTKDFIDKNKIDFFKERVAKIEELILKLDNPENKIIDFYKDIFFLPKEFEGYSDDENMEYLEFEDRLFRSPDIEAFKTTLLDYINFIQTKMNREIEKTILRDVYIYSGSKIMRGVKGWEKKGYQKLNVENQENLGQRLANLGFNGYISCDGCEVFISHSIMEGMVKRPYFAQIEGTDYKLKEIIDLYNAEFYPERKLNFGLEHLKK